MSAQKELKIEQVLFWILILLLIILLLWRALGSSPPVEAVGLVLTAMGAYFGWYGIKSSNEMHFKLGKLESLEQEGKKQTQILEDIKEILKTK